MQAKCDSVLVGIAMSISTAELIDSMGDDV
jgi:hypothetical protein